jgi:hypothetical protein
MKDFGSNRQQIRRQLRIDAMSELRSKYAGTGRGGNLQWNEELCPRRRRRAIARDSAKRQWSLR